MQLIKYHRFLLRCMFISELNTVKFKNKEHEKKFTIGSGFYCSLYVTN